MTLGTRIALYRKKLGITQETLAQKLGVTNQAVSKWESEQCCPDVMLLPKIADIFEITLDALFGREISVSGKLPWEDNDTLRVVLFVGHQMVDDHPASREITFQYEGPALNVQSDFSINCDKVQGNVTAGGNVNCDDVLGNVQAGGNVNCDDVTGSVAAGCNVTCDVIKGHVNAGRNVTSQSCE